MGFDVNEISENSKGGTELMRIGLEQRLDSSLIEDFQIIPSRVRQLDETKIRVLWLHDLPGDPECEHLRNGGYEKFHLLVCVSNWQMQQFAAYYGIPWSKFVVIENACDPIDESLINKPTDKFKIVYHTTPHRGLEILVPVFEKLAEKYPHIELDVFSSFKIYGWAQRDEMYEGLFEKCREHKQINYHGVVSNEEVRKAVAQSHVFAYPSIWAETSCISLMEAMSAKCICIHPNYAALFETSGGTTMMYQWNEEKNQHAHILYNHLDHVIGTSDREVLENVTNITRAYATMRYSWERITSVWRDILTMLKQRYPTTDSRKFPQPMFHYKIG
jgi:glycosyltransferase involved in cell wall biosynthesis